MRPSVGRIDAEAVAKGLDPELRQMIIRGAAEVLGVPCGVRSEVPTTRDSGFDPGAIAAAASHGMTSDAAPDDSLVCTVIDELDERGTLTGDTLRALRGRFGDAAVRKLVLVVGLFNLLSLLTTLGRGPMETDDRIGAVKPPVR